MLLDSFLRYLDYRGPPTRARRPRCAAHERPASSRLLLEQLELRDLLSFLATVNIETLLGPRSVAVGEFNGDGLPDFAVGSIQGGAVHLGNGNGTFQGPRTFDVGGAYPNSVAVGEFNGDGRLDLAVAHSVLPDETGVSVLLGNGDGSFQPRRGFIAGEVPHHVAVGDFNGDGRLDLAVANRFSGCSVLLGNGNGTFQAARGFDTRRGPTSTVVGEFNGDGFQDLAFVNTDPRDVAVSVLLGNGDGTFQPPRPFAAGNNPESVAVGEFNGDGVLDLAVTDIRIIPAYVNVLFGNGDGTFQAARRFAAGPNPYYVAVGEFNGDGLQDLVVANLDDAGTVSVLSGNGDGTFQPPRPFASGVGPIFVAVGDLNRDGRLDLAVANGGGDTVSVLLGIGDGTFQAARSFAAGNGPRSVAVGEFNGDGLPDLAVANSFDGGNVSVLLGNGDGTFQAPHFFGAGANPWSVAVGEFNGDGLKDLAVANAGSNNVSVLLGNGDGTFQAARNFAAGLGPHAIVAGDVNGDGRLDLAVLSLQSHTVSVLLSNGDGTFQAARPFAAGRFPESVAVGEFNGDGFQDLAVANLGDESGIGQGVSLLLGNGDGTFQAARTFAAGRGPWSVAVGEFNGDGVQDLAVANSAYYGGTPSVSILLGNGDGTFQAARNFFTEGQPYAMAVEDYNGDGLLDLAVANPNPIEGQRGSVRVLLGTGDGTFQTTPVSYVVEVFPIYVSVAVGDLDGDGWPDLAVANLEGGTVTVLLNAADWRWVRRPAPVLPPVLVTVPSPWPPPAPPPAAWPAANQPVVHEGRPLAATDAEGETQSPCRPAASIPQRADAAWVGLFDPDAPLFEDAFLLNGGW